MNRRTLLAAMACALWLPAARAQRQGKMWRVGFLAARHVDSLNSDPVFRTFLPAMKELGYVEGRNLAIELRFVESDVARLDALAQELVEARVDVIVAAGATAVRAAQKASSTIPIVMGTAGDPVGAGFIKTLARPGGNITGLSDVAVDMGIKLLDVLHSAVPGLDRVAVLFNPANPSHPGYLASIDEGARANRLTVRRWAARNRTEITAAFSAMARDDARGVISLSDPVFNNHQREIAELAARHRLPCISGFRQYVRAGGLMNYGPDFAHNFQRAAGYVDRIFKGANPGELPVEQSSRFELAVNLSAARALGLTLPPSLLVRADEVLQ
jgi:putative tryptophan/tyrosine transport system substrate-binding protein